MLVRKIIREQGTQIALNQQNVFQNSSRRFSSNLYSATISSKFDPFLFFCGGIFEWSFLLGRTRERNVPKNLVFQGFLKQKKNTNENIDDLFNGITFSV